MKTRILIKRIVAVALLTILVLLLLLFLLINSPLVSMSLEHYLNGFTGHSTRVGSARLSLFPQIKLVAKALALQEEGAKDPFITFQHIVLELDTLKLLDKVIHIPRLDVNGCVVLLTADPDSDDSLLPLSFLTQESGDDGDDMMKEPSGWKFSSINILVKKGVITYKGKEETNGSISHSIENIYTQTSIGEDSIDISTLEFSYKDAALTISGSINNYLKDDPESNVQITGDVPFSVVQEYLPGQLIPILHDGKCTVLLTAQGPLSRLLFCSEVKMLASPDVPFKAYVPSAVSLKALLESKEHLQVESLNISAPSAEIQAKGAVHHFLSEERKFRVTHTLQITLDDLAHHGDTDVTAKGTLLSRGVIEGGAESFDTTTHIDLSSVLLTLPGVLHVAEGQLGSVEIRCSGKNNRLQVVSRLNSAISSDLTVKGEIGNVLSDSTAFNLDLQGRFLLPAVVTSFPALKEKDFTLRGESPLHIVVEGSMKDGSSITLEKGIVRFLGSKLSLRGSVSDVFSEECYLSLDSTLSLNAQQVAAHLPGIIDETWEVSDLPAVELSIKGPSAALRFSADCDLKDLALQSPYFHVKKAHADGRIQLEASVLNKSDVDIHSFRVQLKKSHVTLAGKLSTDAGMPELHFEADGTLQTEEILSFLPEPLPEGYSLEGPLLLQALFKGNPTDSFTMDAMVDLTGSFWEDPYFITKNKGIINCVTFSLHRDQTTDSFEGTGDIALESVNMDYSFRYPSHDPNPWHVAFKTSPIELDDLASFKFQQTDESYGGKIAIDVKASLDPARVMESSVNGYVELNDFRTAIDGQDVFVNAQLIARGDRLEVPYLNLQYGFSDFELQETFFSWGDVPRLKAKVSSQLVVLQDFIDSTQEEPLEDEPVDDENEDPAWDFLWNILKRKPGVNIDVAIENFFIGNQDLRNTQLLLLGETGIYKMLSTFQTVEGESSIRAEIGGPFAGRCVQENLRFDISGFNMTELTNLVELEEPPLTGIINADGEFMHLADPNERWINPENLDGQVKIELTDGAIRELALIQNMLTIMKYPIVLAIPIMREIFLADQALKFYKNKQLSISTRTFPY
ncbi:MAG: AsmA family protein, partial [Nitrospiraceae bacterium]